MAQGQGHEDQARTNSTLPEDSQIRFTLMMKWIF